MEKWLAGAAALVIIAYGGWFLATSGSAPPWQEGSADLFYSQDTAPPAVNGQAPQQPNTTTTNQQPVMQATLHTTKGDIVIEFFGADAPKTVENFTKLAREGFYNGTKFHRVIAGFMIQGGDPLSKDDSMAARWGTGGPGYQFADEIHANNRNAAGTISMANAGPNTNGSQFFITTSMPGYLNGRHTIFGEVVKFFLQALVNNRAFLMLNIGAELFADFGTGSKKITAQIF
jgi:cyclophilin family peptidyl-prolyl cis-trans isomerase